MLQTAVSRPGRSQVGRRHCWPARHATAPLKRSRPRPPSLLRSMCNLPNPASITTPAHTPCTAQQSVKHSPCWVGSWLDTGCVCITCCRPGWPPRPSPSFTCAEQAAMSVS